MSRQANLPPRCPLQKKIINQSVQDLASQKLTDDSVKLNPQFHHKKSISQSSITEEHPSWLADLLEDSDSNSGGVLHRRSASDSLTLLDDLSLSDENDNSGSCDSENGFKSFGIYGPNSPRAKGKSTFPETAFVSALSECVSQSPLQISDGNIYPSKTVYSESTGDMGVSAGETNAETMPMKRHPGQRSRVRKLQYIAELERAVDAYQTLESELAARLASLLQLHAALLIENNQLKQQAARLLQEKLIADAQYRTLKREADRLKTYLPYSYHRKGSTNLSSDGRHIEESHITWQMLDMTKLGLH